MMPIEHLTAQGQPMALPPNFADQPIQGQPIQGQLPLPQQNIAHQAPAGFQVQPTNDQV
jgi:hypothetical protein